MWVEGLGSAAKDFARLYFYLPARFRNSPIRRFFLKNLSPKKKRPISGRRGRPVAADLAVASPRRGRPIAVTRWHALPGPSARPQSRWWPSGAGHRPDQGRTQHQDRGGRRYPRPTSRAGLGTGLATRHPRGAAGARGGVAPSPRRRQGLRRGGVSRPRAPPAIPRLHSAAARSPVACAFSPQLPPRPSPRRKLFRPTQMLPPCRHSLRKTCRHLPRFRRTCFPPPLARSSSLKTRPSVGPPIHLGLRGRNASP